MNNYFPGIGYVISMALGLVVLDNVIAHISPVFSLLVTSLFAVIFFHLVSNGQIRKLYATCWKYRKEWFMINVLVGIIWLGTYYCVLWLNPTACLFLFFLALTATHYTRRLCKEREIDKTIINIIVPIIFIGLYTYFYQTDKIALYGIIAGVIAGSVGSYYNTSSKFFAQEGGLTASHVLAVRFYLIIFSSLFFIKPAMFVDIGMLSLLKLLLVSLFTFILPLYMSQRSIMQLSVDKHTMVVSMTPLVAYLLQGLLLHQWSWILLLMSTLTVLFSIISIATAR